MKKKKLIRSAAAMLTAATMLLGNTTEAMACTPNGFNCWNPWGSINCNQNDEISDINCSEDVTDVENSDVDEEDVLDIVENNDPQEDDVEDNDAEEISTEDNDAEDISTEDTVADDSNDEDILDEVEDVTNTDDEYSDDENAEEDVYVNTFVEDGGKYSIGYILNNYNLFVRNEILDTNHTLGPIACGGDANLSWWGMRGVKFDANSFIKGDFTHTHWLESVGGGDLYLGTVNKGKYEWKTTNYDDDENGGCFINKETGYGVHNTKNIFYSDNYIDFDQAFDEIISEVNGLDIDYVIDENIESDAYFFDYSKGVTVLNIRSGNTFSIDSLDGIDNINIFGDDIQSAVDTILLVDSSAEISLFPDVKVNGTIQESSEYGMNSSIVFAFPNTTAITMRSSHAHFGHIIAPCAFVKFPGGGDYNGCVICNKLDVERHEGHMWPYNGKKFEGAATGFKVTKTVNGEAPTADEIFDFTLEEAKDGKWVPVQTIQNKGSEAAFDTIGYCLTDDGDHFYKVSETKIVPGYVNDSSAYVVKVNIENIEKSYCINQNKTESYYKVDAKLSASDVVAACTDDRLVASISFDNKKEEVKLGSIKLSKKLCVNNCSKQSFNFVVKNGNGEFYNEAAKAFVEEYSTVSVSVGCEKVLKDIPYGEYTVEEVETKDAYGNSYEVVYNVNGNTQVVKIDAANRSVDVTVDGCESVKVTNKLYGQIKVTKKYVDKNCVDINDGSVFYVVLTSTSGFCCFKTTTYYDLNGKEYSCKKVIPIKAGDTVTFSNLALGRYYTVTETDKCGNVQCSTADFDVVKGCETVFISDACAKDMCKNVTIKNVSKKVDGKITVCKKDYNCKNLIDGAKFVLKNVDNCSVINVTGTAGSYTYSKTATCVKELETKGGVFSVDGLPCGNYKIQEVSAPNGYEICSSYILFSVTKSGIVNKTSCCCNSMIESSIKCGAFEGTFTMYNKKKATCCNPCKPCYTPCYIPCCTPCYIPCYTPCYYSCWTPCMMF